MASGTIQKESFPYIRQLSSSDDLDDLVNIRGVFKVSTQPTNCPGTWGNLYCETGGGSGTQIFTNSSGVYTRTLSGSPVSWKSWIQCGFVALSNVVFSTDITDFDDKPTGNTGLRIVTGLVDNQAYISFDINWIRLQFRTQSSGVPQTRTIYGNTIGTWRTIA